MWEDSAQPDRQYNNAHVLSALDNWDHKNTLRIVYVIFITFVRKQWLCERVSMLRYTYIVCLL